MAGKVWTLGFPALVCALVLGGCKDKGKQEALAEAQEARTSLAKVKGDLARARRELADLKEELAAVKDTRDELHAQVERLIAERGGAIATTEKTQETVRNLTAQSSQQAQTVGTLQNETKELRALVENQQTVITEQQALIGELQKTIEQLQGATGQPGGTEGQARTAEPNKVSGP
jgi:uncharacterized coiled-coil DUF342 family protein